MDETVLATAIGFSVLLFAVIFAVGHYRREMMRKRVIGEMQRRRLYDLSRPKH
ncbi:hypothetical protein [Paraburkholderia phenazinium]|jgi:hypothetical protein|uniref:Uncharacterized protein n=1 Tax=Paraburkholderia phenazinium TaxID=60549 RepID=A0A1G7VLX4_9BURK|nr:hypothetical protein [Paraburkholderia phenazinium]SDG60816.1 hypothetical protein SAMN05216466_104132 [Paraburkholderia phenazinium]